MSPEEMKLFLDELAILTARHRIEITVVCRRLAFVPESEWFDGYAAFDTKPFGAGDYWAEGHCKGTSCVASVDPRKISNHARLKILARMT